MVKFFSKFNRKEGKDLLDIFEKLNIKKQDLFPFDMYGHYTEYGYKTISDIIYNMTQS